MTINGVTLAISSADVYTDLDCNIQEAYKGSTNCNGNVTGDFPELVPGSNTIRFSGFSKLEIVPHWYTI
jgi:phage-related protein